MLEESVIYLNGFYTESVGIGSLIVNCNFPSKQCRLLSDATFCCVWSLLFANVPFGDAGYFKRVINYCTVIFFSKEPYLST